LRDSLSLVRRRYLAIIRARNREREIDLSGGKRLGEMEEWKDETQGSGQGDTPFTRVMYRKEPRPADAEEFRTKPAEYRYNGRTRVRFDSAHLDDLSWMLFVYNTANNNCRWGTSMIFVGIKNDPGDFMNYVEPFKVYSTAKDR